MIGTVHWVRLHQKSVGLSIGGLVAVGILEALNVTFSWWPSFLSLWGDGGGREWLIGLVVSLLLGGPAVWFARSAAVKADEGVVVGRKALDIAKESLKLAIDQASVRPVLRIWLDDKSQSSDGVPLLAKDSYFGLPTVAPHPFEQGVQVETRFFHITVANVGTTAAHGISAVVEFDGHVLVPIQQAGWPALGKFQYSFSPAQDPGPALRVEASCDDLGPRRSTHLEIAVATIRPGKATVDFSVGCHEAAMEGGVFSGEVA